MEDLLKKFLYTGVGLVSTTAEKLQKAVDELVDKGKLSKDEGAKVVEDLKADTQTKRQEYEARLKSLIDNALSAFQFPSKTDMDSLVKRVEALEAKLAEIEKAPAKKTATKTKATTSRTKKATPARKPRTKKTETVVDTAKDAVKETAEKVTKTAKKLVKDAEDIVVG